MMAWNGQSRGASASPDDARNAIAPRAVNPSCFGTLEDAMTASVETAERVERLVNRLCGSIPEPASKDGSAGTAGGLLDAAANQALLVRSLMSRINGALDRLESQLP